MIIWLSSPVLQSRNQSNIPPPSPPQLSACGSDLNLTGIPSSWSACWALLSTQTLGAAPTLAQACLDYLHPHWCNPVLNCAARRISIWPSYCIFCPGKVPEKDYCSVSKPFLLFTLFGDIPRKNITQNKNIKNDLLNWNTVELGY